jgi:hypothetical protein
MLNQNEDYKIGYRQGLTESATIVDTISDLLTDKPLTAKQVASVQEWLKKTAKDLHKRAK